jgi:flagellar basal-body rod modification protein FlgD
MQLNAITASGTTDTPTASRIPTQTLGQSDFLKLLAAQLSAQDPLNPVTDTDFIAQMAQFTQLEQTKSMKTDLAQLNSGQQWTQANALLGQTVGLETDQGDFVSGVVSAIQSEEGTPKLVVNGALFDLSQVQTVVPTPSSE